MIIRREIVKKLFCMFSAIGAGAKGMAAARVELNGMHGRWQCLGGMDIDHQANRVFERQLGVRATTRDLRDREQYIAMEGHEPPPGWIEAMPADVRAAAQNERPDAVFLSAPCKGFSGLLSETKSKTAKYQALNRLTLRGVWLMLEAWPDDLPPIILFENVPRMATRGKVLLDQICAMLRAYGYVVTPSKHNCGEIGNLAQSRERFLLVARRLDVVPNFLYEPPRHALRAVGDVLRHLPLAGDARGGVMHRLPSLQWRTWVRLAFVEAGSDWRSLNRLAIEDGNLRDYLLVPAMNNGGYGVRRWDEPTGVVASESRPSNGAFSVADPRVEQSAAWNAGQHYGVHQWTEPTGTIGAQQYPNQGRFAVADPRVEANDFHGFRVVPWAGQAGTVTSGRCSPGSNAQAVADPRRPETKHNNCFRVVRFDQAAGTVTGGTGPSAGGQAVADPRHATTGRPFGKYHCADWNGSTKTVISSDDHGAYAVADPRPDWDRHGNNLVVGRWDEPSRTVIAGGKGVQGGYLSIADPRSGLAADRGAYLSGGHYGVVPWSESSGAVSSAACHDNGRWSVADPRIDALPAFDDRLIATIIAEDGTHHRPFTTLELAALQSLFDPEDPLEASAFTADFTADVSSDSMHREWIGNAVPKKAAMAIGTEILRTLMLADAGETFALSATPIWVRPVVAALTMAQGVVA